MNTRLVNSAAGVILAALTQNRTAAGIALALDSAQLLTSPEKAAELVALRIDALNMRGALSPNGFPRRVPMPLGKELAPAVEWLLNRVDELEAAPTTVYRAEHPDSGITLGHYGTASAARAHCEATERRSWPAGTALAFDWIEDDEDRVAELVVTAGQNEESTTGYLVTALEAPSEYDEEADE